VACGTSGVRESDVNAFECIGADEDAGSAMSSPIRLQQKARGERPIYFDDPSVDKVLSIALALAGEVAVLRDRLDSLERLSEKGINISPRSVDAYEPDAIVRSERDAWREQFLDIVLRAIHQDKEELERQAAPYEEAVRLVESPDQNVGERVL
jgi:hypothetical protein